MSDRVFLATKTNVGIDIDNKPPTAEISIARREINIQPVFPDYRNRDSIMPTFAAFGLSGPWINPRIRSEFAGGMAAVEAMKLTPRSDKNKEINDEQGTEDSVVSDIEDNNKSGSDAVVCLDVAPQNTRWREFLNWVTGENEKTPKPFYFATDTSYGLKAMWSGTAGPYPDSLKLGYNRKEYASAPIFVEEKGDNKNCGGKYMARMPSFYASIDNSSGFSEKANKSINGSTTHTQFFATGQAAYEYSKNSAGKEKIKGLLFPEGNGKDKSTTETE